MPITRFDVWIGQSQIQLRRMRQLRTILNIHRDKMGKDPVKDLMVGGRRDEVERLEEEFRKLAKISPFDCLL